MNLIRKWRCPHSNVQAIDPEEAKRHGGRQLFCNDCLRLLDGPGLIGRLRSSEVDQLVLAEMGVLTEPTKGPIMSEQDEYAPTVEEAREAYTDAMCDTTDPTAVAPNELDDWFRKIGTQLSDEDYERGMALITAEQDRADRAEAKLLTENTYVSSRKLESLPNGSRIRFEGGVNTWIKQEGKWIVPNGGIRFSAKGLVNFTGGRRFSIFIREAGD